VFKVLDASSSRGRAVELRLAVTYSADREKAEGALLEAVGRGPGGRTTGRLALSRLPGGVYRLRTNVSADGLWRFEIDSRFPPGSTAVEVKVGDHPRSNGRRTLIVAVAIAIALASVVVVALRLRRRAKAS